MQSIPGANATAAASAFSRTRQASVIRWPHRCQTRRESQLHRARRQLCRDPRRHTERTRQCQRQYQVDARPCEIARECCAHAVERLHDGGHRRRHGGKRNGRGEQPQCRTPLPRTIVGCEKIRSAAYSAIALAANTDATTLALKKALRRHRHHLAASLAADARDLGLKRQHRYGDESIRERAMRDATWNNDKDSSASTIEERQRSASLNASAHHTQAGGTQPNMSRYDAVAVAGAAAASRRSRFANRGIAARPRPSRCDTDDFERARRASAGPPRSPSIPLAARGCRFRTRSCGPGRGAGRPLNPP